MKATDFEFRQRFWVIGLVFMAGFACYNFDQVNVVVDIVNRTIGSADPRGDDLARVFFAFGTLLAGLASMLRTWATAYLRSEVVHDANLHSEAIVADGPYRYVRNPLYLGNILLALGVGLLASATGFLIIVVGNTLVVLRLIGREEAQLEAEQGERFREFCRRVPRLIPSLRPGLPASGLEPRWGQAFTGEAFIWGFFFGMLAFTITFSQKLMWIFFGAGLATRILLGMVEGRKSTAPKSL